MKRILILFAMATLFAACSPVEYDTAASITGTVVEDDSGEPIGQVTVTLKPDSNNTETSSDGHFEFNEIEAQRYTIWVQKTGYGSNSKSVDALGGKTVNVTIKMKKQ